MHFDGAKASAAPDESQSAIRPSGHVGDLRGAISSDAAAENAVGADLKFLCTIERHPNVNTAAAAGARVSESAARASNSTAATRQRIAGRHKARINASAVIGDDSEHLVVAAAGLEGGLDDEVRRGVRGVTGSVGGVEYSATGGRSADKERSR